MTQTIDDFNGADIIDIRDVIERVEELRDELNILQADLDDAKEAECETQEKSDALAEWQNDNAEELQKLESLLNDLCGYGGDEQWNGDWYPVTLIHENYFEQSMDEMVADCYTLPKDMPYWMSIKLDYDALKQDYTEVEFEGNTYYYR